MDLRTCSTFFSKLPLEIREEIYRHLLTFECPWITPISLNHANVIRTNGGHELLAAWPKQYWLKKRKTRKAMVDANILFVSRQAYLEARNVLLRNNPILLYLSNDGSEARTDQICDVLAIARILCLVLDDIKALKTFSVTQRFVARTDLCTVRVFIDEVVDDPDDAVKHGYGDVNDMLEDYSTGLLEVEACNKVMVTIRWRSFDDEDTYDINSGKGRRCTCRKDESGQHVEVTVFERDIC